MRFLAFSLDGESGRWYQGSQSWLATRLACCIGALSGLSLLLAPTLAPSAQAQGGPATSGAIVSEFRFRGPGGAQDEYVELYNTQSAPLDISGWSIRINTGTATTPVFELASVPANTVVPARGHFLFTGASYSLSSYAAGDASLPSDVPDDSGVALLNAAGAVQDAAGFAASDATLREGTGLSSAPTSNGQCAFTRYLGNDIPQDTGDNASDFRLVSTTGSSFGSGVNVVQGAPGPQNLASPTYQTSLTSNGPGLTLSLFDTSVAVSARPNWVRVGAATGINAPQGTLLLRRRLTNNTSQSVTRLRIRITQLSTLGNRTSTQGDLRLISSIDEPLRASVSQGGNVPVSGLTLEAPSTEGLGAGAPGSDGTATGGGGINSSVVDTDMATAPLAPGESRNYGILFRVVTPGNVSINLDVEALQALTAPPAVRGLTATAGNGQVTLDWTAAVGATAYKVFRATTSGGYSSVPLSVVSGGTTYIDTAVTAGMTYFYVVRAVNENGTSANSNEASATPAALELPAAPTNLMAHAGDAQALLEWDEVGGATSYGIKRATNASGPFSTLTLNPTAPEVLDTGLSNGTTYFYRVFATNAVGNSPDSVTVFAQPVSQSTAANPVLGGSFESPAIAPDTYRYATLAGSEWSFDAASGIVTSSYLADYNGAAPEGDQVGFLQDAGAIEQSVSLSAGTYAVRLLTSVLSGQMHSFAIQVDGKTVSQFTPINTPDRWRQITSAPFTVAAGNHTLKLVGVNTHGAGRLVFVDRVQIVSAPLVQPPAEWRSGNPINSGGIRWPASGAKIQTGTQGHLSAFLATDFDQKDTIIAGVLESAVYSDACSYSWSASGGTFKDGRTTGQGVVWIAPTTPGIYTLRLSVDDQNQANQPVAEGGARGDALRGFNDEPVLYSVNVEVVPYSVTN